MRMDATARRSGSNVVTLTPAGGVDPLGAQARESLRELSAAIATLSLRVDERFGQAARLLYAVDGHVVISGLGKSGLVGRKIAATLASTGTPSFFVHSGEALHGDLGMITDDDAVLLISQSGKTPEVLALLPHLRERGILTVALVGDPESPLAAGVDIAIDVSVDGEICPNNLAPTSSTLATLAMGDALAVALTKLRGFHADDFARLHPSGSLGRRLSRLRDVVVADAAPVISPKTPLHETILILARSAVPLALVRDAERFYGVVTATELEHVLRDAPEKLVAPVLDVLNQLPPIASPDVLVGEAERRMEREDHDYVLVVDGTGHIYGVFLRSRRG